MNVDERWYFLEHTKPAHLQEVIYYSPYVGVWRGKYDDVAYCFYGAGGFIDGYDVEMWMPDKGQTLPPRPVTR